MGQFSMTILAVAGSILSGNQHPYAFHGMAKDEVLIQGRDFRLNKQVFHVVAE
jgi:hypothetical protein